MDKITKDKLREEVFIGLSEDVNGEFYPIYDFNKLCEILNIE